MLSDETYEKAARLAFIIWGGIDLDFKTDYSRKIWQIFENQLRVAANHNGSLQSFISDVCRRLHSQIGLRDSDIEFIGSLQDNGILNAYRQDTAYVVLMVRQLNKKKKGN